MKIILVMLILISSLFAYKIVNDDNKTILFIGGKDNNRISINCGEEIDEDYALKVCGKILASGLDKDSIDLDFKDDEKADDEGDDDHNITFTMELSKKASKDISFRFKTSDDSADSDDYDAVNDTFTIPSGEDSIDINITIHGDSDDEDDESFNIEISEVTNANLVDSDGKYTMNNDDDSGMFSDRRLKKDITTLDNPLEKLTQIKGVTFNWRDKKRFGEQEEVGVIAQDVEKIYPQIVEMGSDGYRKVKYYLLVAPLIEAVKELKKENEALAKRIKALEDEK